MREILQDANPNEKVDMTMINLKIMKAFTQASDKLWDRQEADQEKLSDVRGNIEKM